MTKLKVFPFDVGGPASQVAEKVEKEGNRLLADNPGIAIDHISSVSTASGQHLLLVFFEEKKKEVK